MVKKKKIKNYKVLLVDLRFKSPLIQLIGQPVKTQRGDKVVRCVVHVKRNACARSEGRAGVLPLKSLPASPFPPVFSLVMGNVWVSRLKCAEFQMHTQAAFSSVAACSLVCGSQLVRSRRFAKLKTRNSWVSRMPLKFWMIGSGLNFCDPVLKPCLPEKSKSRKVSCHILFFLMEIWSCSVLKWYWSSRE